MYCNVRESESEKERKSMISIYAIFDLARKMSGLTKYIPGIVSEKLM